MSLLGSIGSDISSLLGNAGLGSLNLGSIGSDILSEGKDLLGQVVKDSFTLSNQPNQTFASTMSLDLGGANVNLPNPIGSLANSLLGDADSELNKIGVNVNFKQVAQELFNLPTQAGTTTSVPSLATRAASGSIPTSLPTSPVPTAVAVPQANVVSSAGLGGGGSAPAAGLGGGGVSTTSSSNAGITFAGNGSSGFGGALTAIGNEQDSIMSGLSNATFNSDGTVTVNGQTMNQEQYFTELQMQMNTVNQCFEAISNMLQSMNQTATNTIGNVKG